METIAHINLGERVVHRSQAQLVSLLDIGTFGDGGYISHIQRISHSAALAWEKLG